ncbi:HAD family hydrolase [Vagococcus vulneris]|uniref:HAD family hydrolase n=1 Tax=Vagococcus vulneris TaxID=1977869 RepID=UPI0014040C59|nr:HAD family phosphatase [Vagococcus vulneris]
MKNTVIFDIDGVIINSEFIYRERRETFFKLNGVNITENFQNTLVGSNPEAMMENLFPNDEKKQSDMLTKYIRFIKTYYINYKKIINPDIYHVIDRLKNQYGMRIAIASAGTLQQIIYILQELSLYDSVDYFISGEEVAKTKPAPDIYLELLNRMDCLANDCIVVEDSEYGIKSAKTAGIDCLALQQSDALNINQTEADEIILSLNDIFDWLN